jgi:Fe-S-cluster containining protein
MMPCVTGMEWKVIREYLEDNSRELPFFQGLVCPFLLNNRCQIYAVRPTGCRIFFCNIQDRDFQGLMSWLERVKAIDPPGAEEYRPILDWFYGEYY